MYTVILATGNKGKVREMQEILRDLDVKVYSMGELGIHMDVEENGSTYEENARIKALALRDHLHKCKEANAEEMQAIDMEKVVVLADDSGMNIDALNGEPGIYTARYAGENATNDEKCQFLLEKMKEVPKGQRQAVFVSVIVALMPDGTERVFRGEMPGEIADGMYGTQGFGYDPIYYLPEYGKTVGEIPDEIKNQISHRAKALQQLAAGLYEAAETFGAAEASVAAVVPEIAGGR